jgi:hypothetical protein
VDILNGFMKCGDRPCVARCARERGGELLRRVEKHRDDRVGLRAIGAARRRVEFRAREMQVARDRRPHRGGFERLALDRRGDGGRFDSTQIFGA